MFKSKDIMTESVITARPEMPIYDAIRLLAHRNITGLPVVDAELNLVGVLSEKDVLKLLNISEDHTQKTVSDFMSSEVKTFDANSNLVEICDCLIENPFRRVPIVEDGKLAGLASRSDIIKAILKIKKQDIRD